MSSENKYSLHEVKTKKDKKDFLNIVNSIYKNDKNYVKPLDNDIESVFDPEKNKLFDEGAAIRWIAKDSNGKIVGRIAAFYNTPLAQSYEMLAGGVGFFESIDSKEIAHMMFDAARKWLEEHGMQAMDGPINFGDRDQWWGLLVDGFHEPVYGNNYNPAYYKELFESYGFKNYFDQHTYRREIKEGLFNQSVYERAERLLSNPEYKFGHCGGRNLVDVAEDFRNVFNKGWAEFNGVKQMTREHSLKLMNTLKPIIDKKLLYFAHYESEAIGFFLMIPDINQIIKGFNGKLNFINKLRFAWNLKIAKKHNRIFALIFGIVPQFQGKGVEAGIIHKFESNIKKNHTHFNDLQLTWIGDFNPVMMRFAESFVCAKRFKLHTTYRLIFDSNIEFTRAPRLGRSKKTVVQE